jgi:hypothetical protein
MWSVIINIIKSIICYNSSTFIVIIFFLNFYYPNVCRSDFSAVPISSDNRGSTIITTTKLNFSFLFVSMRLTCSVLMLVAVVTPLVLTVGILHENRTLKYLLAFKTVRFDLTSILEPPSVVHAVLTFCRTKAWITWRSDIVINEYKTRRAISEM